MFRKSSDLKKVILVTNKTVRQKDHILGRGNKLLNNQA